MPEFLDRSMEDAKQAGVTDCKQIAQDNDILYTHCKQKKQTFTIMITTVVVLFILIFCGLFYLFW